MPFPLLEARRVSLLRETRAGDSDGHCGNYLNVGNGIRWEDALRKFQIRTAGARFPNPDYRQREAEMGAGGGGVTVALPPPPSPGGLDLGRLPRMAFQVGCATAGWLGFVPWTGVLSPLLRPPSEASFLGRARSPAASGAALLQLPFIAGFAASTSRMAQEMVPAFALFRRQSVTKRGAGGKAESPNHPDSHEICTSKGIPRRGICVRCQTRSNLQGQRPAFVCLFVLC